MRDPTPYSVDSSGDSDSSDPLGPAGPKNGKRRPAPSSWDEDDTELGFLEWRASRLAAKRPRLSSSSSHANTPLIVQKPRLLSSSLPSTPVTETMASGSNPLTRASHRSAERHSTHISIPRGIASTHLTRPNAFASTSQPRASSSQALPKPPIVNQNPYIIHPAASSSRVSTAASSPVNHPNSRAHLHAALSLAVRPKDAYARGPASHRSHSRASNERTPQDDSDDGPGPSKRTRLNHRHRDRYL